MNSPLDLLLYEIVRSYQQELLESARASRALAAAEPTTIRRMLRAFGRRFRRRAASGQPSLSLAASSPGPCYDGVVCQQARARKDAA
jgi:hypothetical protein